jgi:hypothetical protein
MSWVTIEGEELVRLKRRINKTGWKTNCLTAGRARVSFYANGNLLYLKGECGTACAVEGGDGTLFPLDGSSAQIYEGNEAAGLRLDINNVIDYAIFFCGFLRAADGDAFRFVVERRLGARYGVDSERSNASREKRRRRIRKLRDHGVCRSLQRAVPRGV